MAENLPDTNIGNIEYISKQDAINCIENMTWYHVNVRGQLVAGATSDTGLYKAKDVYKGLHDISPADVVPYSIEPDGTLTVTVPKGMKRIGRILIGEDGTQYGGLFYPDTGGCFLSSMERSEQDG